MRETSKIFIIDNRPGHAARDQAIAYAVIEKRPRLRNLIKNMKDRDRYVKIVEWPEEDNCSVGSVPGWIGPCCHGDNEQKVYDQLCRILDEWIETYNNDGVPLPPATLGKNYSGKFQLRTGSSLPGFESIEGVLSKIKI